LVQPTEATRFPKNYKAFIMRNPVLNIGTNCVLSVIPNWFYYETGLQFQFDHPPAPSCTPAVYKHVFECSPTAHIDSCGDAPILFLLGEKDRRVPNYEALNWFYYLKSRGKPQVDMLIFPEDSHALDSVDAEWFSYQAACALMRSLII
jgi:acylaminoacyl-peptidase